MNRRQLLGGLLVAPVVAIPTVKIAPQKEINLSLKEALIRLPMEALMGAASSSEEVMCIICREWENVDKFHDMLAYIGDSIVAEHEFEKEYGRQMTHQERKKIRDQVFDDSFVYKYDNNGKRIV